MAAPELAVPPQHVGGAFANYVQLFVDLEYVTLDFARLDPRDHDRGTVVARVTVPRSAIIDLSAQLDGFG